MAALSSLYPANRGWSGPVSVLCSGDVVHEGVEAVDQAEVAFGFGIPSAVLGVVGEGSGVLALGLEDGQVGAGGVEAGAVLADVGVAAGSLGWRAKAVAACQCGLDGRCGAPVDAVVEVLTGGWRQRADALFGQVERSFVFVTDGGVEQAPVAQAHLGRGVPEDDHEGLEGDAGVDQGGGVGVTKLVRGDVPNPGSGRRPTQLRGGICSSRGQRSPTLVNFEFSIGSYLRLDPPTLFE